MTDTTEQYYAEMEAARNDAEDAYFNARPLMGSHNDRAQFRAGYERAYRRLWKPAAAAAPAGVTGPIEVGQEFIRGLMGGTPARVRVIKIEQCLHQVRIWMHYIDPPHQWELWIPEDQFRQACTRVARSVTG